MTDEIPQWALERAAELANKEAGEARFTVDYVADLYMGLAFARYIAQHEEDPLLIEARELAVNYYDAGGNHSAADKCRSGEWDHTAAVQWRIEGLRRGIELGKAGAA